MDPISALQVSAAGGMVRIVELLPVGYAFGAGMMSAVNPCGFALLPTYLALFLGSREEAFRQQAAPRRLAVALGVAAVVSLGFVLLFGAVGGLVLAGARAVIGAMPWISLLIGIGLVTLGAWMLAGRRLSSEALLRLGTRITGSGGGGLRGYFLYGVTFGICSVSCTLPVFLVVVGSALATGSALLSLLQFVSYGLGMALVVTVATIAVALVREGVLLGRMRRLMPWLQPATGVFVMLAGVYIVYYWLFKGDLLA